ncbi:MAG: regulatory protein GemA [Candidatus Brocadia sinica]|nr:regulatory protein GemA [Candidatus Brocadia sinica]
MAKGITKAQKAKIWTKAQEIGMAEEQLRDLVRWISGQDSTRELTKRQGIKLIDVMEGKRSVFENNPLNPPLLRGTILTSKKDKKIIGRFVPLATPGQLSFIENLKKEAGWDDEHLTNFIRKRFNKDILDKLGGNEAGVVMTVLKRAKKKLVTEV